MPRNVVTLVPKRRPWPSATRVQAAVLAAVVSERRPDPHPHNAGRQVELSFPTGTEWFAGRWPSRSGELANRLNSMPKYVVSSTLHEPDWNNSTVLEGDAANEVSTLKQELTGEILVPASFQLVRTLMEHDLVDELRLKIYPVVLGDGKRLRRDQRRETHAPRRHQDDRWRRRLPHLRARPRRRADVARRQPSGQAHGRSPPGGHPGERLERSKRQERRTTALDVRRAQPG